MIKNSILVFSIFAAFTLICSAPATGQVTINIPNIPGITKRKTPQSPPAASPAKVVTAEQPSSQPAPANSQEDWGINYHVGEIMKFKKKVDDWDPIGYFFPSVSSNDDYIGFALSKDIRSSWFTAKKWASGGKLDAALDSLKESLYKRIPEHKLNPQAFPHRNTAEEKMMVAELQLPAAKIFRSGFEEASWLIDKNELGIPRSRFKRGLLYGRNPNNEDPFCRVWYVNVIQDYAGGGIYAAAYARFLNRSIVACP